MLMKAIIPIGVATALLTGYLYLDNKVEVSNIHASVPVYEDVKSLEQDADLIVIGEATDKKENWVKYLPDGEIEDYSTKRSIKVKKVFSNKLPEKIEQGDEIEVWEPTVILENEAIGKKQITIEGYRLMQDKKKYVLFLKRNPHFNNLAPLGVIQGKFPLNGEYDDEFDHMEFPPFKKLKNEVAKKYKEE